ncbi:MAG: CinA family protein [Bdellovibrionales bacterium]|nr:CinA family protein [Bdellovibrionales bacterium]
MPPPLQKLKDLQNLLRHKKETLSVAESCTGGKLSEWLTFLPGSSDFFKGGVVSYWTEIKESFLQVDSKAIEEKGVVSEETARLMAQGIKKLFKTDWSLSITGFAGPPNKKKDEEVGKVVFALCSPFAYQTSVRYFKGEREDIRNKATHFALDFLLSELKNNQKEEL